MKTALVLGAGGFIGSHLVRRLKREGYWVKGVDFKFPEFSDSEADEFVSGDLREQNFCREAIDHDYGEVFQLAADMGGSGYVFTGANDAKILYNNAQIDINVIKTCHNRGIKKIFYPSSACIYPAYNQSDPGRPVCSEDTAYPAAPDSDYGWEKLFSERLYLAFQRNYGLNIKIARLHNIFGPLGTWRGGREKAPAAICRKVAETEGGSKILLWGDGSQTRSFLYIDECIEAIMRLMCSDFNGPVNIGSDEMISVNQLADIIIGISGKKLERANVPGPVGVRGRNSDNRLLWKNLGWKPIKPLIEGLRTTYWWIDEQVKLTKKS